MIQNGNGCKFNIAYHLKGVNLFKRNWNLRRDEKVGEKNLIVKIKDPIGSEFLTAIRSFLIISIVYPFHTRFPVRSRSVGTYSTGRLWTFRLHPM